MEIYLVGGAVRDTLLGYPIAERDYVVVGASPEHMVQLGYRQVGKDFPVFLHPQTNEEYALARTERKNGRGYTGFAISASPEVTLEQDLLRRDLTINAIAQAADGQLIDPYGGLHDIAQRQLRHVSPAFAEDPLRVLRVARFAARFASDGFSVAADTIELMRHIAAQHELESLSCERVWRETEKALASASPAIYFEVLAEAQALTPWFTELTDSPVLADFLRALSDTALLTDDAQLRWIAAVSELAPAATAALNQRLRVPTEVSIVSSLAQLPEPGAFLQQADAEQLLDWLNRADCWRRPQRWQQLLLIWHSKGLTTARAQQWQRAYQQAQLVSANELIAAAAADGEHLVGPAIGERLQLQRLKILQQALS